MEKQGSSFSMRKVAEEASLSLGNLQYHFRTKAILLKSLLDHYLNIYNRQMDENIDALGKSQDKSTLEKVLGTFLSDECGHVEDEFEQVFFRLSSSGPLSAELKDHYFRRIYGLIFDYLTGFSSETAVKNRHQAASFLLPYIESYSDVEPYLQADTGAMASILADTVWRLLHPEDSNSETEL